VERVSTVGYYAIKQCLIGFITERGDSRRSVCAITMPKCSADKGLKAVPIRGVSYYYNMKIVHIDTTTKKEKKRKNLTKE